MSLVLVLAGAALVLLALREVFHTLFHPAGQGPLTMLIFRSLWRASGPMGARARTLAGPTAMASAIAAWTALLVAGWALIYWPYLPERFIFASGLAPSTQGGFLDALYLSWVTQATLGYGDIAPEAAGLRLLAPLQATIGFGVFTAAVTWVLSIYPALSRRRVTAGLIHAIQEGERRTGANLRELAPAAAARRMEALTVALVTCRVDIVQYPSTVYFASPSTSLSLAAGLPAVTALASDPGLEHEARVAAGELSGAIDELAAALADEHLRPRGEGTDEILRAYRRHHRLDEDAS